MDTMAVSDLLREGMVVVVKVAGPMLILSMAVGVILSIFQAVTQIHEQTLSFIFKLVVIVAVLLIGGGWMLETLIDYTMNIFSIIAS